MKTRLILAGCLLSLISCKQQTSNTAKDDTAINVEKKDSIKQEPTDPEATELWEPVPEKVATGQYPEAPGDAIVLLDGENKDAWESLKTPGEPAPWILNEDGSLTVKNGTGDIRSKQEFGDIQLHVEWKNPETPRADGQNRGNSGIFLQGKYEIQVLDTYDNKTYVNGQAGSVYKQHIPLVNAGKPSGEWQYYDIIYHAPQWDAEGNKIKAGTVTLLHNGVVVQDHVTIKGTTEYIGWPKNTPHGDGPVILQDHNDNSGVSYRNIWVREL